jgi:sec-independent protein translocase protein TatC
MNQMPLVEHLAELRVRLVRAVIIIIVGCIVCYNFSDKLFDVVRAPILPYLKNTHGLVFTAPMDKFMAHLKLSLLAGMILTCPLWFYQLWKFISPGLHETERKMGAFFILFGSTLFITGNLFAYYVVYPTAFDYLMNFGGDTDTAMITIDAYMSFFISTTLIFGVAFELPLILIGLSLLGIIDANFLASKRRYAIVVLALASAILTPSTDLLSMVFMLIPMTLLYESSIWIIRFMVRKKKNAAI